MIKIPNNVFLEYEDVCVYYVLEHAQVAASTNQLSQHSNRVYSRENRIESNVTE